jgi:autophagy-related protein 11
VKRPQWSSVTLKLTNFDLRKGLEFFLHQETGVDEQAILAYLSDGRRLENENVRELAGAHDQVCT